jgi:hypothetical protein
MRRADGLRALVFLGRDIMGLQNRVTPDGDIVTSPARGTMLGNRGGCFHRDDRTLKARHWVTRQWIVCLLAFKGRHRRVMQPGFYTELFFLDEATAFAAGHRPCFECRRADAERFARLWAGADARARASAMDQVLHRERLDETGSKRVHLAHWADLADGVFVRHDGVPRLVNGRRLYRWTLAGYDDAVLRPRSGRACMLTPPSIAAVIAAGYEPAIHHTMHRA